MDSHAPPIEVTSIPNGFRVIFRSPIQMDTAEIESELDRVVAAKPRRVEVDLGATEHLSTVGLGLLISMDHRLRQTGGSMHIIAIRERTMGVLRTTRLDKVLHIEPNALTAD